MPYNLLIIGHPPGKTLADNCPYSIGFSSPWLQVQSSVIEVHKNVYECRVASVYEQCFIIPLLDTRYLNHSSAVLHLDCLSEHQPPEVKIRCFLSHVILFSFNLLYIITSKTTNREKVTQQLSNSLDAQDKRMHLLVLFLFLSELVVVFPM